MYEKLSSFLTESPNGITKDIVEVMFGKIEADSQEELNVKSALLKQSFLNEFELQFELGFLNASEKLD
jgi:hypothetical protein